MKFEPIKVTLTEDERHPFLYLLKKFSGPGLHALFEVANGNPVGEDEIDSCRGELLTLRARLGDMESDLVDDGDWVCIVSCVQDLSFAAGQLRNLRQLTTNLATLTERALTTRGQQG